MQTNTQLLHLSSTWYLLFFTLSWNPQIDLALQDLHASHCCCSLFWTSKLHSPCITHSWCLGSPWRCGRAWEDAKLVSEISLHSWDSALSPFRYACKLSYLWNDKPAVKYTMSMNKGLISSLGQLSAALPFGMIPRMWQILFKYKSFLKLNALKLLTPGAYQGDITPLLFSTHPFTFLEMQWVLFNYSFLWSPNLIFWYILLIMSSYWWTLSSEVVIHLDLLAVDVYQSFWCSYQLSLYFFVFELYVKSGAWKLWEEF